jgi:N-acetylmuramoyl-L-alanine amidase
MPGIMARWQIRPEGVIAHSDMAPERKSDPGPRFDWQRLARQGLSIWPASRDPGGQGFDALSMAVGYPAEAPAEARLNAFRDRFHPGATGAVNGMDLGLLADLAARFPVDRTPPSA